MWSMFNATLSPNPGGQWGCMPPQAASSGGIAVACMPLGRQASVSGSIVTEIQ